MTVERNERTTARTTLLLRAALALALFAACAAGVTCGRRGTPHPQAPTRSAAAHLDRPAGSRIDQLLAESWKTAGAEPAPLIGDGEFVRRATLDLAGRVPTSAEAKAFLADTNAQKRAALIDRLLASDDFDEHWSEQLTNLFIGSEVKAASYVRTPFKAWLQDSLKQNQPWNHVTTEQLAASGDIDDYGAIGYLWSLYVLRGVEGAASTTARTVLGIQVQCAQCHDHPYDSRYKRSDFYAFAAFFAESRAARRPENGTKVQFLQDRNKTSWGKLVDTQPLLDTPPRLFGRELPIANGVSRRQALAQALVASPLFAKATVNRTWWQLFGRGLVDPWDDLGAERDKRHPPLLDHLAGDFAASGYNLKRLIRQITTSEAYARSSRDWPNRTRQTETGPERVFARASVRPLSSTQLLRSLYVATGLDADIRERKGEDALAVHFGSRLRRFQFVFQDDELVEVDRFTGGVAQALTLLNGDVVNRGGRAARLMTVAQVLERAHTAEERVSELFLAAFSRMPTPDELVHYCKFVREQAENHTSYEDLFAAMLNSVEFVTNH